MMIPLITLGLFSSILVNTTLREEITNNNTLTLSQVRNSIELIFNELDGLSINYSLNASFVVCIKNILSVTGTDYEHTLMQKNLLDIINTNFNTKPYIHSIYVYYENNNKNMLVSGYGVARIDDYPDNGWFHRYLEKDSLPETYIEVRNVKSYDFEEKGTPCISIYKKLYSPGISDADGMIVMNIRQNFIQNLLSTETGQTIRSIFLSANDSIIAHSKNCPADYLNLDFPSFSTADTNPSTFYLNNGEYICTQIASDKYDIQYISVSETDTLFRLSHSLSQIVVTLLIISFSLGCILSLFFTYKNCKQIDAIVNLLNRAEMGKLLSIPSKKANTYEYIEQEIIKSFLENQYLQEQFAAKKYQLASLELIALQTQINPHFLFNTLKSIFWKTVSLTESQNDASKMIEHLSSILQYSLSSPKETVTLGEELENTEDYIEIQKMRKKDRFDVIWQYSDDITNFRVVKLLFQPLIENSLSHGFFSNTQKGIIKIKIFFRNNNLFIHVIDNGCGISKENLNILYESFHAESNQDPFTAHIGLVNTYKRVKLIFGEQSQFKILSRQGKGTAIQIRLPANTGE